MSAGAGDRYAEVAVFLPLKSTFHYKIPKKLQPFALIGQGVRVPFGHRQMLGVLVGFAKHPEVRFVKPISEFLEEKPSLTPDLLELTRWISQFYLTGWGETLSAALPGTLRRPASSRRSRVQKSTEEEGLSHIPSVSLTLNAHQQAALDAIRPFLDPPQHRVFLLHGVTGSGKTEVYLQAIQSVLTKGKSSIVLVPEIALTPQTIQRFQGRFGQEAIAVLHSGMLQSRRLQEWERIRSGQAKVVIGARSAVFAPVQDLGLLVVDEEHEPSYKQEDAPRYHAREAAIRRGQIAGVPVILGSATPSLEIYHQSGGDAPQVQLLALPQRVEQTPLPKVEIVDMREELATGMRHHIFSRKLEEALAGVLKEQQQAILFLNRRGFSTFVHCPKCGHVLKCVNCQLPYTYHMASKKLLCHHCDASVTAPEMCPHCRSQYIRFHGTGTERVESELARLFPEARIARLDSDITKVRGSHIKILEAFRKHETDILVGTQMVAKGLDFPKVTLVGVISADTALNLPDFRSAERTFQLLTQVAGRAGRRNLPGRVIVQTYAPHHYAILAAQKHDYLSFYRQELEIRRQLKLPPFTRMVRLMVRSASPTKAAEFADKLAEICRPPAGAEPLQPAWQVLGPAPAPIPRLRRQYRFQVLLKADSPAVFQEKLPGLLEPHRPPKGCYLAVDVDPL